MIEDPYKVLGVSEDATKDEIKRAYRRKAKEYHPDLHPNDPEAAKKMNEINEAYDMLNNPQKYKNTERNNSSAYGSGNRNPYERARWNGDGYQNRNFQGGFDEFDFEDIFGFSGRSYETIRPKTEPEDNEEIKQAIDFINMNQFGYASATLNSIIGSRRNARWYYLSALTNQGLGNTLLAAEQIDRALQMEPGNEEYQRVRQNLHKTGTVYNEAGKEFQRYAENMGKLCMGFCASQFFCMFCCR